MIESLRHTPPRQPVRFYQRQNASGPLPIVGSIRFVDGVKCIVVSTKKHATENIVEIEYEEIKAGWESPHSSPATPQK